MRAKCAVLRQRWEMEARPLRRRRGGRSPKPTPPAMRRFDLLVSLASLPDACSLGKEPSQYWQLKSRNRRGSSVLPVQTLHVPYRLRGGKSHSSSDQEGPCHAPAGRQVQHQASCSQEAQVNSLLVYNHIKISGSPPPPLGQLLDVVLSVCFLSSAISS